jgi:DNA-binding transcriptional ArsR family regulator
MVDARDVAALGALIGDPARARMLTALMSGTALTATELALEADVAPSTASSHLAKLTEARLLTIEKQGRHRYFRLSDEEIAEMIEGLMEVTAQRGRARRTGPSDPSLRFARVCYDHLAGELGVWMFDQLKQRSVLSGRDALVISSSGEEFLDRLGVDVAQLSSARRPLCRTCVDWSERRHHLSGAVGAAILQRIFTLRWARRETGSRAVVFSSSGERMFRSQFTATVSRQS